jgi:hypothetical protein
MLCILTAVASTYTIGGLVLLGVVYAIAPALTAATLLIGLSFLQLPFFLLYRRMGLIPAIRLGRPAESETDDTM